jgi:hypothetical protein
MWFSKCRRYARPVAQSFGERPVALENTTSTAAPIASQNP